MSATSRAASRRVAVVGDYMLDAYVDGNVARVCPDAPAPVLDATSELWAAGGAGNVAAGCTAHGLEVVACGFTGRDPAARTLETLLAEAGVGLDGLLAITGRSTLVKRRFTADDQVLLRVDEGTVAGVSDRQAARLADVLERAGSVVVSDYGYGTLTRKVRALLRGHRERTKSPLVVDSKSLADFRDLRPDLVKPNYRQFCETLSEEPRADRATHVADRADDLLDAAGAEKAIVTLDREGCVVLDAGDTVPLSAPHTEVRSTSGAGDSFLVSLVAALFSGATLVEAAAYATRSATVACSVRGTVSAARHAEDPEPPERHKRVPPSRLSSWAKRIRAHGRSIALTNGCFDIFHAGHAEFLQRAAEKGEVLLVAVNTDASVAALKGPERPVNTLEDRLRVLEAIGVVGAVTWFDDDTAEGVTRLVKPDAYVKGSDYRGETFPEAEFVRSYGGEVAFVDLLDGRSTTDIVERVRSSSMVAV